jgi:hypothetical protein
MQSSPTTALCKESYILKVVPCLFSISNEIYSSLHIWKNVLYYKVERPGWWRKLQNMNVLGSF